MLFILYNTNYVSVINMVFPYLYPNLRYVEKTSNMDIFWSGLAQRASEHTRIERRSQFSKIHETAIQDIEMQKQRETL